MSSLRSQTIWFIVLIIAVVAALAGAWFKLAASEKSAPPDSQPPVGAPPNIVVAHPAPGDLVQLPFSISGSARVFENVAELTLTDLDNNLLFSNFFIVHSPDIGLFGPFNEEIRTLFTAPVSGQIILNVFWQSPKDDSPLDVVAIPLNLDISKTTSLDLYYSRSDSLSDCRAVFPVTRLAPLSKTPARLALNLLFAGVLTPAEAAAGCAVILPGR